MRKMTVAGAILLALVAGAPLAAFGEQPAPETAAAAQSEDDQGEEEGDERPFIERSLVLAPEQVGKFALYSIQDYPGDPGAGVGVRYRHADFPEVRIDLFVYPVGRVDRDEAVAGGIAEVRGAMRDAQETGRYTELEFGEEIAFDLRRVDADGSLRPEGEPAPESESDSPPGAAELLALVAGAQSRHAPGLGRRLEARLGMDGQPIDSRAYLFYRGLFLYKGRISASPTQLPGETFDRFTNHAMASLVPAVQVRSTGGCHENNIYVDPADKSAAAKDAFSRQMLDVLTRSELEQCGKTLDDSVPAGFRAQALEFPPDAWRSTP